MLHLNDSNDSTDATQTTRSCECEIGSYRYPGCRHACACRPIQLVRAAGRAHSHRRAPRHLPLWPGSFSSFGPTRWIFAFAFAFALTFTWIASPARPSPASARGSLRRPGHRPFRQPARVPTPTVAEHRPAPDQDPPRQRHRRLLAPRLLTLAQSLEDGLAVRVVPQHPPRHLHQQLPEPPAPGPADPPA